MKIAIKRKWSYLIVIVVALSYLGAWAVSQVRSVQDRSTVAQLSEKMKTVCVGRYLVDVPAQADVTLSRERLAGIEIQTLEEDEARFRTRMATREAEIATRGSTSDGRGGLTEARDLRIPGMLGRTMIFGHSVGYLMEGDRRVEDQFSSVEVHAHVEGRSFTLSAKYADESRARLAEALLARLRLRGEEEIPPEPGFCIRGAFFLEPLPVRKAEHIAMRLSFPEHSDVEMMFLSMPGGGPEPGLLARVAETDSERGLDERLRTTKLRAKKRSINGLDGEEALERFLDLNFATTYSFIWEAKGIKDDALRPFLSLELQAGMSQRAGGRPVDASLHQDAILALWDNIASSIRLRGTELRPPKRSADPVRLKVVAATDSNKP
jgi:hypothetical protein